MGTVPQVGDLLAAPQSSSATTVLLAMHRASCAAVQSVLGTSPEAPALLEDDDEDDDFVLDLDEMLAAATQEDAAQLEQASTAAGVLSFLGRWELLMMAHSMTAHDAIIGSCCSWFLLQRC